MPVSERNDCPEPPKKKNVRKIREQQAFRIFVPDILVKFSLKIWKLKPTHHFQKCFGKNHEKAGIIFKVLKTKAMKREVFATSMVDDSSTGLRNAWHPTGVILQISFEFFYGQSIVITPMFVMHGTSISGLVLVHEHFQRGFRSVLAKPCLTNVVPKPSR